MKSVVIYAPNYNNLSCIPSGNVMYSAVITSSRDITGVYHSRSSSPSDVKKNRTHGAPLFSNKEADKIYFIPRFYFNSFAEQWYTGIVIQNATNSLNSFKIYILDNQGKVITQKSRTLKPYQATHFYGSDHFPELVTDQKGTNYPPISTPTLTPNLTKTPILTPTNVFGCGCISTGICADVCPVNQQNNYWNAASQNNISYAKPMKCFVLNPADYTSQPDNNLMNQFCNRNLRPKGDVDGQDGVTFIDYLYYVQIFSGGKLPNFVNADVNGDGSITPDDGKIIRNNVQN
jgi:ferredoxin